MQENFTDLNPAVYSGNGNILGIVYLQNFKTFDDLKNQSILRKILSSWGIENNVDSVMVLINSPSSFGLNRYHFGMYVFEPRGSDNSGLAGSWSAMCGNGVMAVALFYENNFKQLEVGENLVLFTLSGLREVEKISNAKYSVKMGEFTNNAKDLRNYVNTDLIDSKFLFNIKVNEQIKLQDIDKISIGLSGDPDENGFINGEPHAVIILNNNEIPIHLNITEKKQIVRNIALANGQKITKNFEFFPFEINANFAYIDANSNGEVDVIACTHERGLGNNPEHSITGACGTGSTAIGATLYKLLNLRDDTNVNIYMPSGVLTVYKHDTQYFLIGSAKPVML